MILNKTNIPEKSRNESVEYSLGEVLSRLKKPRAEGPGFLQFPVKRPRLLYAVNHSYPFSSNGYAVRTHRVASELVRAGISVVAATRPGMPWEQKDFVDQGFALRHVIDGVSYLHSRPPRERVGGLGHYLNHGVEVFAELIRVFKPTAVMAASNWKNALPAAVAAREAGLPFFYEVRGFWEISRASRDPEWGNSSEFESAVKRETAVGKSAQRIFTLNRHMREELVRRGVENKKVDLVPNGFLGWPKSSQQESVTRAGLGIFSRYVVGYIGSFNAYEGLEDLIKAVARLRRRGVDVSLLLVGSGQSFGIGADGSMRCEATVAYQQMAADFAVGDFLFMPGRVPPELSGEYYALLDLVVLPRRPHSVCEIVSPLKPLEAAAYGKKALLSDVAPLKDLANLRENFSYFSKGNIDSLTETLRELLESGNFSPPRCAALETMTWEGNVKPIVESIHKFFDKRLMYRKKAGCVNH